MEAECHSIKIIYAGLGLQTIRNDQRDLASHRETSIILLSYDKHVPVSVDTIIDCIYHNKAEFL